MTEVNVKTYIAMDVNLPHLGTMMIYSANYTIRSFLVSLNNLYSK